MATFVAEGSPQTIITREQVVDMVERVLANVTDSSRMLVIPPDTTRSQSGAGIVTEALHEKAEAEVFDVLPALGTHRPMTREQIRVMYGEQIPLGAFKEHDWRTGLSLLGHVPARFVHDVSGGVLEPIMPDYDVPIQINDLIVDGGYTALLSVGQVVPHEVTGMANGVKNVAVGVGGAETINKSHFLGAAYGMERMMGRIDTPVRRVLNYAHREHLATFGIIYILTVIGIDDAGDPVMRGFFAGDDLATFTHAADLTQQVNIHLVDEPLQKTVVYASPDKFKSTWLSNKAIYRTRMAIADGGHLIILAPGVDKFGEDTQIDALIRKYGYRDRTRIMESVRDNDDLRQNLCAAAHLIHGSSEGRFNITYATDPDRLSREEVQAVGFTWMNIRQAMKQCPPEKMRDGFNDDFYFVREPGMGLWALAEQFDAQL